MTDHIRKLEKQRMKAIKLWDVPLLDKIEAEILVLKAEANKELDKIIEALQKELI